MYNQNSHKETHTQTLTQTNILKVIKKITKSLYMNIFKYLTTRLNRICTGWREREKLPKISDVFSLVAAEKLCVTERPRD